MKAKHGNSRYRGAIIAMDAFFALVLVALIFSIGFYAVGTLAKRYSLSREQAEKDMSLLILGDRLAKEELAVSDGERIFQHEIDLKKIGKIDLNEWKNKTGLKELRIRATQQEKIIIGVGNSSGFSDCVRRLVLIEGEVGLLEVCA